MINLSFKVLRRSPQNSLIAEFRNCKPYFDRSSTGKKTQCIILSNLVFQTAGPGSALPGCCGKEESESLWNRKRKKGARESCG